MNGASAISSCTQTLTAANPAIGALAVWVLHHPSFATIFTIGSIVIGRAAWIVFGEYVKFWVFKGIPPWRVSIQFLRTFDAMEKALIERTREFDAHHAAVSAALERAEVNEGLLIRFRVERHSLNGEVCSLREKNEALRARLAALERSG